jgi:hypothetical protein
MDAGYAIVACLLYKLYKHVTLWEGMYSRQYLAVVECPGEGGGWREGVHQAPHLHGSAQAGSHGHHAHVAAFGAV